MVCWRDLMPRIVWGRCNRRRWAPAPELAFSREQRCKPRHVLLYFWAGEGRRLVPGGEVPVATGSCHWSRPGWSYACTQSSDDPLGITAIHFDLVDAEGRLVPPSRIELPPEVLPVQPPALAREVTGHIAALAMKIRSGVTPREGEKQAAEKLLHGLLLQLDAGTAGMTTADGPAAVMWTEVANTIQENLQAPPSVEYLAHKWGYSRSHFTRRFTGHFGLSPQAYMVNARMSLAKELLRETDLSCTQIASLTGFGDLARFSSRFRQKTGLSPTAYRAQADR